MLEQEMVFGKFLRERRTRLSLTTAQLAAGVGYQNINKGIRRITAVENGEYRARVDCKNHGIPGSDIRRPPQLP